MIEMEKKILLEEREYRFLLDTLYPGLHPVRQVNHYYDTANFAMNEKRITCRVREKGDTLCATVKYHANGNLPEESMEYSFSIGAIPSVLVYREQDLLLYGSLETERRQIIDNGLRICIDQNRYLGTTDYELEIEYEEGRENSVARVLRRIADALVREGLIRDPESFLYRLPATKSERFFARFREQKAKEQAC